ncbi:MAG: GNAT family N-acetyltransferase [Chitinophagaceae bacterium]|nr:GNAT family N-acetyltransferase [Chitinophagaceae bacterium]
MILRTATPSDNTQLVALARVTPMPGPISICVQREPDFFAALRKRGRAHVIVAETEGIIAGCVSIVEEDMMVLGVQKKVRYLCDLKVHPGMRNRKVGTLLCRAMHSHLLETGADLIVSTVAEANHKVMPLFNGKSGIPGVDTVGKFYIHQLLPSPRFIADPLYTINIPGSMEPVVTGYRNFMQQYALYPLHDHQPGDVKYYAAYYQDEMVASVCLSDMSSFKQNILVSTAWYITLAVSVIRALSKTVRIPGNGEEIKLLYARGCWHAPGHAGAFKMLMSFAKQLAFRRGYSFLTVALHEKDPLRRSIKGFRSIPYEARGMICALQDSEIVKKIKAGIVMHDFSGI